MTGVGQELKRTAEALAALATKASYVAIGAGVLGFQRAQVRRRDHGLNGDQMAKRAKELDATVAQVIEALDSSLEPVLKRLPEPVQAAVQQAREARDELRTRVFRTS